MKTQRYTAEYIDTVKAESSISAVITDRGGRMLRTQSANTTVWPCPFDCDGEFLVRESDGYYLCHTCGQAGDSIALVQVFDKVTFTEAITHLGERFKPGSSQLHSNFELEEETADACSTYDPQFQSDTLAEECPDQDCEHLDESNVAPMYAAEGHQASVGILNEVGEVIGHFDGPIEARAFALRLLDLGSNLLKAEEDRPRLNDADVVQLKDFRGEQS